MSTAGSPKMTFADRDAWMRAVLASDLPHAAARVAIRMALCLRINTGRCDPTHAILATESGVPERSVYRLVAVLEQAGWIARERTRGRHSNRYVLLNPDTMTGLNPDTMTGLEPANPDSGDRVNPDSGDRVNPANMVAVHKRERRKRAKKENGESDSRPRAASRDSKKDARAERAAPRARRKPKELGPAFDRFWSTYPRPVAKEAAWKAFVAAVKRGADPEALIEGAARYAAERASEDPRYTKHPATWLNAGCWQDEPQAPQAGTDLVIDNATGEPVPAAPPRRRGEKTWRETQAEYLKERGNGRIT
jgi:hypothetical protein